MPTFEVTSITVPATGASVTLPMTYPADRRSWVMFPLEGGRSTFALAAAGG